MMFLKDGRHLLCDSRDGGKDVERVGESAMGELEEEPVPVFQQTRPFSLFLSTPRLRLSAGVVGGDA